MRKAEWLYQRIELIALGIVAVILVVAYLVSRLRG